LLETVHAIAREAGTEIMAIYASDFSVTKKKDSSPLTRADMAAHELIVRRLGQLQPALPTLSEEGVNDFAMVRKSSYYWLIDPLDGTREFVHRNGEFTVNIALIAGGRPVLGVVYAPCIEIAYLAGEDVGAFRVGPNGIHVAIQAAEHTEGAPWRIIASRNHAGESLALLRRVVASYELVSMGSSLKFCLVAEGSADIYPRLGNTSLWDTAAAQCVVEQAGGKVLQLTGKPLSYADPLRTLNPFFVAHGPGAIDWPNMIQDAINRQLEA
jgi:3'(2'), 5'-bisphosphate nucleotidase